MDSQRYESCRVSVFQGLELFFSRALLGASTSGGLEIDRRTERPRDVRDVEVLERRGRNLDPAYPGDGHGFLLIARITYTRRLDGRGAKEMKQLD